LYNFLIDFGIPMNLVWVIKMKRKAESEQENICLTCFLLRMV